MRHFVENCALVDVAERPIVVTLSDQFPNRTRRIWRMRCVAFESGVQHGNVEHSCRWLAVCLREVLEGMRFLVAAAVHGNANVIHDVRLAAVICQLDHALGRCQVPCDAALSVVITVNDDDTDASARE